MKYRKKPIEVEAIQWNGRNLEEIKKFVGSSLQYSIMDAAWEIGKSAPHVNMKIHTLEGDHECTKYDYIIKGVEGEYYPCKPDIFEKTYCRVEENEAEQPLGKTEREPVSILIQFDNGECKDITNGICIDLAEDKENMTLLSLHVEKKEFVAAAYCMLAAVEQMGLTDALQAVYTYMTEEEE